MAEGLVFVELVAGDGPSDGEETLSDRRVWKPPGWIARLVAAMPRVWTVAALVVLVGGLLAADQVVRNDPLPPAPVPDPGRPPPTAGLVYADRGHCPAGVSCTILGRPRQDMWDSYDAAFDHTTLDGGTVWFEPHTGVVYYQELDASGPGGQRLRLVEQRLLGPPDPSFGPTVDFVPDTRHAGLALGRRAAIVTTRRGAWLVTATLSGPPTARLPVGDAIRWTMVAPLPGA